MTILKRIIQLLAALVLLAVAALCVGYWRSADSCDGLAAPAGGAGMQAAVHCEYGAADVLQVREIAKPEPAANEVRVRVHAASINPLDWHYLRGTPYVMRLDTGLRYPKDPRIGVDFAGTVDAVGAAVTRFKPGDEVFGGRSGALAQYLVVREDRAIALKPATVSFGQAAAVGIAGTTALQALRDTGALAAGQKVLINGASGGVGTFAVQIARALGAEVTGVCSGRNAELVRGLGAARVIDYTTDDFTRDAARYDLVIDNVGNRALSEVRRVMTPQGRYVLIGGGGPDDGHWIGPLIGPLKAIGYSWFNSQQFSPFLAELNAADLATLAEFMQRGALTPVIDRSYPLAQAAEAIRYLEGGRARGKVIITMD